MDISATPSISGFLVVKDAARFGYPVLEVLRAALPVWSAAGDVELSMLSGCCFLMRRELIERTFESVDGGWGYYDDPIYSRRPKWATSFSTALVLPALAEGERLGWVDDARLRALSDDLQRRRWEAKLGTTDRVLVDRPGRGYGDDYTPWLVDAEVGQLVSARAVGLSEEGILAVAA
mgnify:CR=1 FL=1